MKKNIQIEEAKNQKTEEIPVFETYYVGFARYKGNKWFQAGIPDIDKQSVIDQMRMWSSYDELKIISIELPF